MRSFCATMFSSFSVSVNMLVASIGGHNHMRISYEMSHRRDEFKSPDHYVVLLHAPCLERTRASIPYGFQEPSNRWNEIWEGNDETIELAILRSWVTWRCPEPRRKNEMRSQLMPGSVDKFNSTKETHNIMFAWDGLDAHCWGDGGLSWYFKEDWIQNRPLRSLRTSCKERTRPINTSSESKAMPKDRVQRCKRKHLERPHK